MAQLPKNSGITHLMLNIAILVLSVLALSPQDSFSREPLENELAKALAKTVRCEKIEVKIKGDGKNRANPDKLLIKLVSMPNQCIPADIATLQYSNPKIDMMALRKAKNFKINSVADFKIGMLFSQQTIRNEFDKAARRLNVQYNKLSIRFTPPYIEVEFDINARSIPSRDRKIVEKFIKNGRLAGYAAIRLQVQGNRVIASPDKVILNHFRMPMPLVSELKKRMNPVWHIPRIPVFDYTLEKVDVLKQYVYVSN